MRRHALLAVLAGLHVAGALLMWRATVALPNDGPVMYANLILVPAPFVPPVPEPVPTSARVTRTPPRVIHAARPDGPAATASPATPPAIAASLEEATPAPTLDLAAMRASAAEHESQRVRSGVELVQDEQRVRGRDDSDVARAIKKAGRTDCTKAYAGGGFDPLKLIPLIYDTLTDTGCKW
ncbi:hypothetical protein [Pseudoduganella plicata]|uniref:Uncharacterized protein n=1 Tax=Pseudoduganella plicata TaxID=321984 RepID=A0A4P7BHF5_9BURK|nr:hypothetical protein [Pseudoduganella plicata]QBQ38251.1 hypothetical protein E1742_20295 [Pseudoduganella plicata]GGY80576.1 hypothetical protein GCM10007388_11550 [Pseudoduganella plicata]